MPNKFLYIQSVIVFFGLTLGIIMYNILIHGSAQKAVDPVFWTGVGVFTLTYVSRKKN